MTFRNILSVTLVSTVMLSACTNDTEETSVNNEYVSSVRVSVDRFKDETVTTRTNFVLTSTGIDIKWVEGDALGVYPVGGDQVKFPLSSGSTSSTASFDGGKWKLRSGVEYAAYYPFSADNYLIPQTAIPVVYTGQTMNGNNPTVHLGAYDYLACAASTPNANGEIDFQMKHLGAILRLQLKMPKAGSYSKVVLESSNATNYGFVEKGRYDLTAATPTVIATAKSDTYTINLTNVSTTTSNQTITVYAMVAPARTNDMTITVYNADGSQNYVANHVEGKEFQAGGAYTITADLVEAGHQYVDLGLPSGTLWATCNLGANNPEELGFYYAWGETKTKSTYSWGNYALANGTETSLTKYNDDDYYGFVDNKDDLEPVDDAAYANWGSEWCMPTKKQMSELTNTNYTTTEKTTLNGVVGLKITSKRTGFVGKSIFLPAAGYKLNSSLNGAGVNCYYWSTTIKKEGLVYILTIDGSTVKGAVSTSNRQMGQSVRPVRVDKVQR